MSKETRAPIVKVNVRKSDIDRATPKDSGHCMVADAIKDQIPNAERVSVDIQTIRWSDTRKRKRYIFFTPPAVQRNILAFDEGKKPAPFTFNLRAGQVTDMVPLNVKRKANEKYAKKLAVGTKPRKIAKAKSKILTTENRKGAVPTIAGGNPPPTTTVGRRRVFGLREWTHA